MKARQKTRTAQLNLLPVMNLVTILIPLLLISAQFTSLAVIDSTLPGISDDRTTPPEPADLTLSVLITEDGFTVAGADAILGDGPTVPCADGSCRTAAGYDLAELNRVMALVKDEHPDHEDIILVPSDRVPYEVLVGVMDATRVEEGTARLLFPNVSIAGGAG